MITVLFGGSRQRGIQRQLTKLAVEGLDYKWIDLTDYQFNPVRDFRHDNRILQAITMIINRSLIKF